MTIDQARAATEERQATTEPSLVDLVHLEAWELALNAFHLLGCIADAIRERGLGVRWPRWRDESK